MQTSHKGDAAVQSLGGNEAVATGQVKYSGAVTTPLSDLATACDIVLQRYVTPVRDAPAVDGGLGYSTPRRQVGPSDGGVTPLAPLSGGNPSHPNLASKSYNL